MSQLYLLGSIRSLEVLRMFKGDILVFLYRTVLHTWKWWYNMGNRFTILEVLIAVVIAAAAILTSFQRASAQVAFLAPIATSGDKNVYVTWWSNKTGNDEVMFKASTDGGKTFGNKMNLSNSPKSDSQDAQIAAAGSNVYITWWERNQTANEPVIRVSNDNGKSFGPMITLSAK
jgi:hypothetical protein